MGIHDNLMGGTQCGGCMRSSMVSVIQSEFLIEKGGGQFEISKNNTFSVQSALL